MKTADIKRILTTPKIKGELMIHGRIFPFECIFLTYNPADYKPTDYCIMIGADKEIHLSVRKTRIDIWLWNIFSFTKKVKFSEVKILWCIQPGINTY